MKYFNILNVSSKYAICGLPIRADTYKGCSHGCKYCFSNYRKIMEFDKTLQLGNLIQVNKQLDRILTKREIKQDNFLDKLIANNITWHLGGMSDPFQPCEENYGITKQLIDISNQYNIHIVFVTKGFSTYDCAIKPDLHTFQMSITNIDDRYDIEPNIKSLDERFRFFKQLKSQGFKIGIRIQPFIPGVSNEQIIDLFKDADYFTIEGLKLVPQNKEHKEYLLDSLNLSKDDFIQRGLLNIKPEKRIYLYKDLITKLRYYKIPFSLADNDLRYVSDGLCCCGDNIVHKSLDINPTAMIQKYNRNYTLENVLHESKEYHDCKVNNLFTSNRQEGCKTVKDFFIKRFDRKSSPFSPKFMY